MKLRYVVVILAGILLLSLLFIIKMNHEMKDGKQSTSERKTEGTISMNSSGEEQDTKDGLEPLGAGNEDENICENANENIDKNIDKNVDKNDAKKVDTNEAKEEDKNNEINTSKDFIIEGNKIVQYIGGYNSERTITIPEGITEIGSNAFSLGEEADVKNMKKVSLCIPKDVKLDESAFQQIGPMCITFEEGRTMIEKAAFNYCGYTSDIDTYRIEITLPSTIKTIGENSFDQGWSGCDAVTLKLNEGLEVIGDYALEGIASNLPSTVKKLGDYALNYWSCSDELGAGGADGCLELPKGLEEIGYYCIVLEDPINTIKIPASVEKIGEHPITIDFSPALCDVIVDEANQYYKNDENGWLFTKDGKTLLYAKNSFEEVVVPEGVEYAAEGSLDIDMGGDGIPYRVILPKSLKKFHRDANNSYCVEFKGDPPELTGEKPFWFGGMPASVYIPKGKSKAYKEALRSWGIEYELIER